MTTELSASTVTPSDQIFQVLLDGLGRILSGSRQLPLVTSTSWSRLQSTSWTQYIHDEDTQGCINAFVQAGRSGNAAVTARLRSRDGWIERELQLALINQSPIRIRARVVPPRVSAGTAKASTPSPHSPAQQTETSWSSHQASTAMPSSVVPCRPAGTESAETLAGLLDNSEDAIVLSDRDDRVTYWNLGAERLFGRRRAAALGRPRTELLAGLGHPPYNELVESATWSGDSVHGQGTEERVLHARLSVRHHHGIAVGTALFIEDVTAARSSARHRVEQERVNALGILASGVAHDLKNLFTPLLLASDLLQQEISDPAITPLLDTMSTSIRRGAGLIDRVMATVRGERVDAPPFRATTLVHELERYCQEALPPTVQLRTEVAADLPPIVADREQALQVLVNLVDNASDAMDDDGCITVSVAGDASRVVVIVTDTGPGFSAYDAERAFTPFFTTKQNRWGTGLGLAASRAVARSNGGDLEILLEPHGHGAQVVLTLPAEKDASTTVHENSRTREPRIARGARRTIVVLHPDRSSSSMLRRTLEFDDYRVVTAQTAADAVAWVQNLAHVDLIVAEAGVSDHCSRQLDNAHRSVPLLRLHDSGEPNAQLRNPIGLQDLLNAVDAEISGNSRGA